MSRTRILVAACLLGALILAAWVLRPGDVAGPCVVAVGPATLRDIGEASGLAASRRSPGVLWAHNDSENAAVLFALDFAGTVIGRVPIPIQTRDWEDVSVAACPGGDCVYVADIGDNASVRRSVRIYRVPEPAPGDAQTAPPEVFTVTYADGPHNAEAVFVVGQDLYIVTKDRTGGLYRATLPTSGSHLAFQRVGELGLVLVTDAETSRDGTSVVVRTREEVAVYRTADVARGNRVPALRVRVDGLKEPQGEGVALVGDMLFLVSEGRPWTGGGSAIGLRCYLPK